MFIVGNILHFVKIVMNPINAHPALMGTLKTHKASVFLVIHLFAYYAKKLRSVIHAKKVMQ